MNNTTGASLDQELLTFLKHRSYSCFSWIRFIQSFAFSAVFSRPLFVILSVQSFRDMFLFHVWLLITPLVSSNFPCMDWSTIKVSSKRYIFVLPQPPSIYRLIQCFLWNWFVHLLSILRYNGIISRHIFLLTVLCILVSRYNDKHALISPLLSYFD